MGRQFSSISRISIESQGQSLELILKKERKKKAWHGGMNLEFQCWGGRDSQCLGCTEQLASLKGGKTKSKEKKTKQTLIPKKSSQNNPMASICIHTCSYTPVHTNRGTHTHKEREKEAHTETHIHRGTHTQRCTHTHRGTHRDTYRGTHTYTQRSTHTKAPTQRHIHTYTHKRWIMKKISKKEKEEEGKEEKSQKLLD